MGFFSEYADKKRIEKTIPHISKNMKILDLGCGNGWLTKHLNENGYDCIGVDTNVKNEHPFYQSTAEKIVFPDESFDCIIMIEVIEHISPSCYKEINRVLKPDGKIILSTPVPEFDRLIGRLLEKLKLTDSLITPHINLVHLDELPWKLVARSSILLIDQFGIFTKR